MSNSKKSKRKEQQHEAAAAPMATVLESAAAPQAPTPSTAESTRPSSKEAGKKRKLKLEKKLAQHKKLAAATTAGSTTSRSAGPDTTERGPAAPQTLVMRAGMSGGKNNTKGKAWSLEASSTSVAAEKPSSAGHQGEAMFTPTKKKKTERLSVASPAVAPPAPAPTPRAKSSKAKPASALKAAFPALVPVPSLGLSAPKVISKGKDKTKTPPTTTGRMPVYPAVPTSPAKMVSANGSMPASVAAAAGSAGDGGSTTAAKLPKKKSKANKEVVNAPSANGSSWQPTLTVRAVPTASSSPKQQTATTTASSSGYTSIFESAEFSARGDDDDDDADVEGKEKVVGKNRAERKAVPEAATMAGTDAAAGATAAASGLPTPKRSKVKTKESAAVTQQHRPGAVCKGCQGKEEPMSFCCECDRGFHPHCLTPPKTRRQRADWVCDDCKRLKKEKADEEPVCPECGLDAGAGCAFCSACGCTYHPMCLDPPMKNRPKGSSARNLGVDWICPLCECAPLGGPPELDDPVQMAELDWSDDFEPPSKSEHKKFWQAAHQAAAADYALKSKAHEELTAERKRKQEEERTATAAVAVAASMEAPGGAVGTRPDAEALMHISRANVALMEVVTQAAKEIKLLKSRLQASEKEIASLRQQLRGKHSAKSSGTDPEGGVNSTSKPSTPAKLKAASGPKSPTTAAVPVTGNSSGLAANAVRRAATNAKRTGGSASAVVKSTAAQKQGAAPTAPATKGKANGQRTKLDEQQKREQVNEGEETSSEEESSSAEGHNVEAATGASAREAIAGNDAATGGSSSSDTESETDGEDEEATGTGRVPAGEKVGLLLAAEVVGRGSRGGVQEDSSSSEEDSDEEGTDEERVDVPVAAGLRGAAARGDDPSSSEESSGEDSQ